MGANGLRVGAAVGGSVVRRSTATPEARVTRMADALSVADGGFSIDARTGVDVRGGFAVAVRPECERRFTGRVYPGDVKAYVFEYAKALRVEGVVFGGWRDPRDGVAYLDVSRVVGTRAEAVALAKRHGQVAYFDFAAGRSVPVV
jgi:hypothetical protein